MSKQNDIAAKRCTTPEFRASYSNVLKPKAFGDQEPKYSVVMLFSKKTDISALKKAANAAITEKWGSDKTKWPKGLRTPFRDGDTEKDSAEYKGHTFVAASSKKAPGVVDQRLNEIMSDANTSDGFYSGCYARATLIAFAYDTNGNRGVSFALQNVQKLRDGKPFSGKKSASEDFDAVEDTSDDASSYSDEEETADMGF